MPEEGSRNIIVVKVPQNICWNFHYNIFKDTWAKMIFGRKQGQKQKFDFCFDFNRYR